MVTSLKSIFITVTILCGMFVLTGASTPQMQTVVSISGIITDAVSKQPTSVVVTIYDTNNKKIGWSRSNSKTGFYLVTNLRPKTLYVIKIESIDYVAQEYDVIVPNFNQHAIISRDFDVIPKK